MKLNSSPRTAEVEFITENGGGAGVRLVCSRTAQAVGFSRQSGEEVEALLLMHIVAFLVMSAGGAGLSAG